VYRVLAALSGAICSIPSCLPVKLSPVVKPLMESIRKEENELFQRESAKHLCALMNLVVSRSPSPVPKIVGNLTTFLCSDTNFTPPIDELEGILSWTNLSTESESTGGKKPQKSVEITDPSEIEAGKGIALQRRGAAYALKSIVSFFGVDLPIKVSKLWELTFGTLKNTSLDSGNIRLSKM